MLDTNIKIIGTIVEKYYCDDDCLQSGCPGHELKLEKSSVSGHWFLEKDGLYEIEFNRNQVVALIKMFTRIKENK